MMSTYILRSNLRPFKSIGFGKYSWTIKLRYFYNLKGEVVKNMPWPWQPFSGFQCRPCLFGDVSVGVDSQRAVPSSRDRNCSPLIGERVLWENVDGCY